MKTINNLRRILLICNWITNHAIIFVPGTLSSVWIGVIGSNGETFAMALLLKILVAALLIVVSSIQIFTMSRLREFAVYNFRHAYPEQGITLLAESPTWVLLAAIACIIANSTVPSVRPVIAVFCYVFLALDIISILTMLGIGFYVKRHPSDYIIIDPDADETDDVIIGDPIKIKLKVDLGKVIEDGFFPAGIICQVDADTGEIRAGVVVANPDAGGMKVVFDDDDIADVDDDVTKLNP